MQKKCCHKKLDSQQFFFYKNIMAGSWQLFTHQSFSMAYKNKSNNRN